MSKHEKSLFVPQKQAPARLDLQKAVANLLEAAGFSLEETHLKETPSRVSESWISDLLSGYQMEPSKILGDPFPSDENGVVLIKNIHFHGLCPHHLLPFKGKVNVAYIPKGKIVGFSCIADLVKCFTRRLTLQELATQAVPNAIQKYLQSEGAGCVMQAEQMCMQLRGGDQRESKVITSHFQGSLLEKEQLQQQLFVFD